MAMGGNNGRMMSDINVTPFVDVMLVLLIIFMVTAPMMTQGVDVTLPETSSDPLPSKSDQLIVTVDKARDIFINKEKVKLGLLQKTLSLKLSSRNDRSVYLKADKEIPYGMVVRVMAEIKAAGVEKLGMVTVPIDSTPEKDNRP